MLRVVMAVSADGFVSRGPNDDMSWTGADDKAAFKLLTSVGGGELACGKVTACQMPLKLEGRRVHVLTRRGHDGTPGVFGSLDDFARTFPNGWIIGGQTVVLEALRRDMVDELHLSRVDAWLGGGQADEVSPFLMSRGELQNPGHPWSKAMTTTLGRARVETWRLA